MSEMIDDDFIDASEIQVTRGRREKPTYSTYIWESKTDYGRHQYYSALRRNYIRRHKVNETPYDHFINPLLAREEEYAKLFPVTLVEIKLIIEEEERKNDE